MKPLLLFSCILVHTLLMSCNDHDRTENNIVDIDTTYQAQFTFQNSGDTTVPYFAVLTLTYYPKINISQIETHILDNNQSLQEHVYSNDSLEYPGVEVQMRIEVTKVWEDLGYLQTRSYVLKKIKTLDSADAIMKFTWPADSSKATMIEG